MNKGHILQDPFLNTLRRQRVPVSIYLTNGIKLQGHVAAFDQYVVLLKNNTKQMVFKHAIVTIVSLKKCRLEMKMKKALQMLKACHKRI